MRYRPTDLFQDEPIVHGIVERKGGECAHMTLQISSYKHKQSKTDEE
jgi:hypothetical protein